ncbi:helix-turn-helix transcriptional regulator [Hydrogenophaga sp. OTU3427]|uniref:helix-turn-helix transcriptional regulator n=1 Tax=Hydrogenophaga sp. OTU3427 TaxID=3043856 RepID=UPI00313DA9EC
MNPGAPLPSTPHRLPSDFDLARWRALERETPGDATWSALPASVRRSSEGRPWPGLALWHQVGPEGDLYVPPMASHTVLVRRAIPTQLVQRQGVAVQATQWQPGQALVVPAGVPSFWRSDRPRDNLHIDLAPAWLQRSAQADVALSSCFGRNDPVLAGFAQLLLASLDTDTSLNRAFGERIAEAIALHLLAHYAAPQAALRGPGGLSHRQLRRVEDAVRADLAAGWTIARLAQLVDLSPFHFARAFKASAGVAPHAWLRLQRMERAAQLVRQGERSMGEIAHLTGHRSAAHFAQAFRLHWGVSPSTYARAA